nr:MAG TPA: hypothetical protein [Microviridae sp.]
MLLKRANFDTLVSSLPVGNCYYCTPCNSWILLIIAKVTH